MKPIAAVLVLILIGGLAGVGGYQIAARSRNAEIARIASVNVANSVRIRKAFDPRFEGEAKDLLDAAISQDLLYMEAFESAVMSDAAYVRQRGRSVVMLKKEWLESPPFAVEDATKSYIEGVCRQTTGCPPGEIRSRKPADEVKKK